MDSLADTISTIYDRLWRHHGPQAWWPAETPFEVMVGAILTQAVAWTNVEKAIDNLKAARLLDPLRLHSMPAAELAPLLRPSGYYNAKARKLKALAVHLHDLYEGDVDRMLSRDRHVLREELLSIHGIGPETADSIILYAAGRPQFVVDAYTRRLLSRIGLVPAGISYVDLQAAFQSNLPRDTALYQEYHALIVQHGKSTCRKKPLCAGCVLLDICEFGQAGREPTSGDVGLHMLPR
jgi:endonuclease-3 related protein